MKYLFCMLFVLLLAGCGGGDKTAQTDVVQTVDWYKAHKAERLDMLKKCNNNPGQLALTPNCVNAAKADDMVDAEKRGVPNVDLKGIKL